MKLTLASHFRRMDPRRALALFASVGLGLGLLALLLAGLRPGVAAAAGLAAPTSFSCNESGLNAALTAGGSATFNCSVPTTITVSARKNVPHNVTLDGGNKVILSGQAMSGVFTVPTGIHLSLLNITLRDASDVTGAAIYNSGVLNVTNAKFISNTALIGAVLYNAPGASATLSAALVSNNTALGGGLWNGNENVLQTAALHVINSEFFENLSFEGAAIANANGPVTVDGSLFVFNLSEFGGAILNNSSLQVNNSVFEENAAGPIAAAGRLSRPLASGVPLLPSVGSVASQSGGAILITSIGDTLIAGSAFTDNFSLSGGGAVMFGDLPSGFITPTAGSLTVTGSTFGDNCTGGPGGALAAMQHASVSDSTFQFNFADSGAHPCVVWAANRPAYSGARAPALANSPAISLSADLAGAGGAVFSGLNLQVTDSSFLFNSATVTPTGGGGAISNYFGGLLQVTNGTFQSNEALQDGGAIYNPVNASADIANSSFSDNLAALDSGGALASIGRLSVTRSTFTGNSGAPGNGSFERGGGAIFQGLPFIASDTAGANGANRPGRPAVGPAQPAGFVSSSLTVDHSTFISNSSEYEGGAIDGAPATIVASTFQGNHAAFGGAIDILGNGFTVSGSTFIANAVVNTTIFSASQGGAIDTFKTPLTNINIVNSTFFANHAPAGARGGAINGDGNPYVITNSTFISNSAPAGKGGALSQDNSFVLHNTLLAFNAGGNCQFNPTLSGANLEYPGTTCGGATVQADPMILAPANNGGPTLTSALLPGSPAIDHGDNAGCPSTDQRGAPRPVGPKCDIGAFEFGGRVPILWLPVVRK